MRSIISWKNCVADENCRSLLLRKVLMTRVSSRKLYESSPTLGKSVNSHDNQGPVAFLVQEENKKLTQAKE